MTVITLAVLAPSNNADRPSTGFNEPHVRTRTVDEAVNVPSWIDQSEVAISAKRRNTGIFDIGLGYQMYVSNKIESSAALQRSPH